MAPKRRSATLHDEERGGGVSGGGTGSISRAQAHSEGGVSSGHSRSHSQVQTHINVHSRTQPRDNRASAASSSGALISSSSSSSCITSTPVNNNNSNNHHNQVNGTLSNGNNIKQDNRDHELFLQAYEKPTQIYRFLRTRFMLSPIFLTRNLHYMRHRSTRNNKSRENFKVDSIKDKMLEKNRNETHPHQVGDFLTLTFLGYHDDALIKSDFQAEVHTSLKKTCYKKRKDSSSGGIEFIKSCEVALNPLDTNPPTMAHAVSLSTEMFSSQGCQSYSLILKVIITNLEQAISNRNNNGDTDDPAVKRFRTNEAIKQVSAELVIFDKQNRCLIKCGDYDLLTRDVTSPTVVVKSPHKSFWETLRDDLIVPGGKTPFDDFKLKPMLRLNISWTQLPFNGLVNRPLPTAFDSDIAKLEGCSDSAIEQSHSNKENDKPHTGPKPKKNCQLVKVNVGQKSDKSEPKLVVIYQFLYLNNTRQQTEASEDLSCPWCSLDCILIYSLLKHLKLCHSRFNFSYHALPNNGARIDVSLNELYDGSFAGSPHEAAGLPIKSGHTRRRIPLTRILVFRPHCRRMHRPVPTNLLEFTESDENEMAESQRPYITGHNRLYHHTITCLPVEAQYLDIDSEGETDPLWLQQKTMMMIDDFTDVNEGEKELMKMWNLHLMKYNFVGDCQIPIACQMFLQNKGKELLEKNLYRNFVLHMSSLHDFGLISPVALYQTIQLLNQILADNPDIKQKLREYINVQREHWTTVGMHQQPTFVEQKNIPSSSKPTNFSNFNGESSPVVRRKTPNVQNSNRASSANYDSEKTTESPSSANNATPKRNNFQLPEINTNGNGKPSNVSQMPLRRKSAGSTSIMMNPTRKRLSLQDRKNST